jgi:ABC-type amino acid transport substrate-binding protein
MRGTRILLLTLFLSFVCLVSLNSSCNKPGPTGSTDDTYARTIRDGRIRVAYISYPPSFIKDPNTGAFSGIFHEVLQEVGKNLGFKIDYTEEVGWGTMIEAIKSNRVDLVCTGLWPTTARGKLADFTSPLYYSTVRAYTRADNSRFDGNLALINDPAVKISAVDGEMSSIIAKDDFYKAQMNGLPQNTDVSQVLLEVATNKSDVTFVEPAVAMEYIKNNPGKIKEVPNVKPLRVFPNVMMVGKGEDRFRSTMNTAIQELVNNGFVDRVIDKYEKYPNSFQRVATPYKETATSK